MNQDEKNEEVLLYVVAKWIILAVIAGAVTGLIVGSFLLLLFASIDYVSGLDNWHYVLIPLGLLASYYSIKWLAPAAAGHGTDRVIEAIHYKKAQVPFKVFPVKIISTIFTLAPGCVVGTEGPSVQVGGAIMSGIANFIKAGEREHKKLVICGVSAALSAVFGAPIAGAIFGVEVLFVADLFYPVLFPAIISGIVSYMVCGWLGVPYYVPAITIPPLDPSVMLWCTAAGVFFAFVCILHIGIFKTVEKAYQKLPLAMPFKSLLSASIILIVIGFSGTEFLGMGEKGLNIALSGTTLVWYALILKSFLLAVTLAGGGSGGVLTPTFYIGAAAGSLFASVFGLDIGFFAALGFVGCIAGAVNTPISAMFLAVELFGAGIAPYAAFVCILSYMLSGPRSLYPTQILVRPKSDAFVLADPQNTKSWDVKPVQKTGGNDA